MVQQIRTSTTVLYKTANEVCIKNFDFSDADVESDETVSSISSVTITPSGELVKDSESKSGQIVQLVLSAGTAGTTYKIVVKVVTSNSQTLELAGILTVGDA